MENELLDNTIQDMEYIGDIPEGWKWVKLGEVVKIIKGRKPETLIENPKENSLPYLTAEYFRYRIPYQFVNIEKEKNLPVCEKDDIILIWDGSQAGQVFTGLKGILASTMVKIIPNLDIVNKAYLYFFLTTKFEYLNTQTTGSAIPHVNKNAFLNLPIPFPPLPEQKAIADVLSSIDDKIELLHCQNKTLEEMAMTLFRQWFIEPTKDGLPDGWEEGKLGDILSVIESGSRPKGGIDPNLKDGIPSIGAENINGLGNYDYSKTKYISKEFYNSMKRGRIQDYDVLIYKDGAYIGKKAMFGKGYPFEKATINEHVFILRGNNKVNQFFLYFLLDQKDLEQLNSNSAQPGLTQEAMKSFEIIIPSFALISRFGELTKPLVDKIFSNAKQIRRLEQLRDTLLPKLMSGEIRVKI